MVVQCSFSVYIYHRTKKDRDHPTENVVLSIGSQMTMKDSRFELKINNVTASYLLQVSVADESIENLEKYFPFIFELNDLEPSLN